MITAMKLAWGGWFYGLIGGFIGGGASAVSTGFAEVITDPGHADVSHLMKLCGVSFIVGGAIATAAFLKQSPLPPPIQVDVKETTTAPAAGGGTKTTELKLSGQIPQGTDKEK